MPLAKGEPWGAPGALPEGAPVAGSDAGLAELVAAHQAQHPHPDQPLIAGLLGGDVWRSLGAPQGGFDRLVSDRAHRAPIDVLRLTTGGANAGRANAGRATQFAVAHVVARSTWSRGGWLRGAAAVLANSERLGRLKVAPAAHPGDGWAHVIELVPSGINASQRLKARRRAVTGDHLPHDGIRYRRARSVQLSFDRPLALAVDGSRAGVVDNLTLEVVSGAVEIVF